MQKIVPHLWFDKEAKEAANFYASVFPDSKVTSTTLLRNTPSGDCDMVGFEIMGFSFLSLSAGPYFKINPSISFMVSLDSAQIDEAWQKLSEGGKVLMPLQKYPFSEKYGWVQNKFGVSWQLSLPNPNSQAKEKVVPSLMFVGDVCGKAIEATDFYMSVFKNSKRGTVAKYGPDSAPDTEDNTMYTDFSLENQWFAAMDSARMHDFSFNEAVSLMVNCKDQAEIDYFWEKLSASPQNEQCGWLKDKFGVSWQIVSEEMDRMLINGTQEQIDRMTQALMPMKKLDIETLKKAYEGA